MTPTESSSAGSSATGSGAGRSATASPASISSASAPPGGPPPGGHPDDDNSVFAVFSRALVWLEEGFLVLLFLALLGLGLAQIIMRNVLGSTPADIETVLRALVLWVAMLGAAVAARRRRHIVVDLLGHYLKPRARMLAGALANAFTAFICLLLTWAGLKMIQLELSFQPVALFGPVPRWLVQLPMPLAFAVMTSQFLLHAVEDLIHFFRPGSGPPNAAASDPGAAQGGDGQQQEAGRS